MGRGLLLVAALGVLAWHVPPAGATMTSASTTNTGSSCGASDADGSCLSSSAFSTPNDGTTFTARYAWNVNADIGIFSTRDISGSARHNVAFTATAPGGYRLDISTARRGEIDRLNDLAGCSGSADTTGVTGSSNITLNSGTLSLADPGGFGTGGSDVNTVINQSSTATIFRSSNGVGQSHSLSFTWSGSVRSNSCEAAVRQGESSGTTTGCSVCGYPGSPSRTASNDGHFVTVTFTSLCGNGTIDGAVSEQCDQGSANGSFASCCDTNCTIKAGGTPCRAVAGGCDVQETCTGSSEDCPADAALPAGTECRASAGVCDVSESCDGSSTACPADGKSSAECRPVAGPCDLGETCNGTSNTCPPDGFFPPLLICRGASGPCDAAETCDGLMAACPPDGVKPAGTQCRAQAGTCDVAESCDGITKPCPIDLFALPTVECRGSAGTCDVAESCPGTGPSCPPDGFASATTECRAAAAPCDNAETCTGSGPDCPVDSAVGAFVECRPAAGDCDVAESCDGVNINCPANGFASSSVQCRAGAGVCDVAESCTGSGPSCPADAFQPATVECRASAGTCDVAETCSGLAAACPPDLFLPDNTLCTDGSACTAADHCEAGACVGTPTLDTCLDDFLCYKAKVTSGTTAFVSTNVTLADDFETQVFNVRKPKHLCTPADKNDGNGTVDPNTHLTSYSIRSVSGVHTRRIDNTIVNQLGTLHLDTVRPDLLLVPTAKDLLSPPPPPAPSAVDHYKCYKVKVTSGFPKFPRGVQVNVSDQFITPPKTLDLKKAKHLCLPVSKNSEPITNSAANLLCYTAKAARGEPKFVKQVGLFTRDQFGALRLDARKESEFCIPSTRSP